MTLLVAGADKLAALSPEVVANPWLRRVAPALTELPTPFSRIVGYQIEDLMALRLDLVILWGKRNPQAADLQRASLPMLGLEYATPAGLIEAVSALEKAVGGEARAKEFVAYYQFNLARVARALEGLTEAQRTRVYYASLKPYLTEGRDSLIDSWIALAGGRNIAADIGIRTTGQVSLEDIIHWAPELVVGQEPSAAREILDDPRWRDVPAVRRHHVLVNPKGVNAWCTRAAENALQILWAASKFHPDRFPDLNLAQETYDFHARFYGYRPTPLEVEHMLAGLPPP